MKKILILEDDPIQQVGLNKIIKRKYALAIINHADTVKSAVEFLSNDTYDILFVDLELPDGSGYEFIRQVRSMEQYKHTWIIILTGTDESVEQQLKAYQVFNCYQYLKKPVNEGTIHKALDQIYYQKVVSDVAKVVEFERKNVTIKSKLEDIVCIETQNKLTYMYKHNKKEVKKYELGRKPLSHIKELLDERFIQIHRSYLVNTDFIVEIEKSTYQWRVKLFNVPFFIPVGDKYRKNLD